MLRISVQDAGTLVGESRSDKSTVTFLVKSKAPVGYEFLALGQPVSRRSHPHSASPA
jgi:hypothetical protein